MSRMTKFKEVPEGWKQAVLRDLGGWRGGSTPSMAVPSFWGGSVPWVSPKDMNGGRIRSTEMSITEEAVSESSAPLLSTGAVLLVTRSGVLRSRLPVSRTLLPVSINQDIKALTPEPEISSSEFAYYLIDGHSEAIRRRCVKAGTTVESVDYPSLLAFPILLPPLPEQRGIAEILGTWDDALATLDKLIEAKQRFKRGLAQKLLSGQLRFKEFKKEKWREVKLGEVLCEQVRPADWSDSTEYRLVSIRRNSGGAFERELKLGVDILTKSLFLVRAGDFVVSKMQVVHGAIALIPRELDGAFVSGSYLVFRPRDQRTLSPDFIGHLSATPRFYRLCFLASYGVHIEKMTLNQKWFLESRVGVPSSIQEQQRIAAMLNAVDSELAALRSKRNRVEKQKRGLMGLLLSGELRVSCALRGRAKL